MVSGESILRKIGVASRNVRVWEEKEEEEKHEKKEEEEFEDEPPTVNKLSTHHLPL